MLSAAAIPLLDPGIVDALSDRALHRWQEPEGRLEASRRSALPIVENLQVYMREQLAQLPWDTTWL